MLFQSQVAHKYKTSAYLNHMGVHLITYYFAETRFKIDSRLITFEIKMKQFLCRVRQKCRQNLQNDISE